MLIKTSAQGLATYRHKDYTGIPAQPLSVNAARRVKREERKEYAVHPQALRCLTGSSKLYIFIQGQFFCQEMIIVL